MNIQVDKEDILGVVQEKIAHILNISIFDVYEISDIDLEMIESSIHNMINRYSHSFAQRQKDHDEIYNLLTDDAYEDVQKLLKEEKEKNERNRKIRTNSD